MIGNLNFLIRNFFLVSLFIPTNIEFMHDCCIIEPGKHK